MTGAPVAIPLPHMADPYDPLSAAPVPTFYGIHQDVLQVSLHEPGHDAPVPEALVHDLWLAQQFLRAGLATVSGDPVGVLHPGTPNTDAGPDFRAARIRIADVEWFGDVEIHLRSADWLAHRHHLDPRYDSVILHVTLSADAELDGQEVDTIVNGVLAQVAAPRD